MNHYPSHQIQFDLYMAWKDYLARFPWQWMVTLTFDNNINFYSACSRFKKWRLSLIDREKLRIGGYILSSTKKHRLHFHALLIGRNKKRKTLLDCSEKIWEDNWPFFARVKQVNNVENVSDYIALHCLGFKSDHAEFDSFDRTLLRQTMLKKFDGFDDMDGLMTD